MPQHRGEQIENEVTRWLQRERRRRRGFLEARQTAGESASGGRGPGGIGTPGGGGGPPGGPGGGAGGGGGGWWGGGGEAFDVANADAWPEIKVPMALAPLAETDAGGDSEQGAAAEVFPSFLATTGTFNLANFDILRGTWVLNAGNLQHTPLAPVGPPHPRGVITYNGFTTYTDCHVQGSKTATGANTVCFVLGRYNPATENGYAVSAQLGTTLLIQRIDAGNLLTLNTIPQAFTAADRFGLRMVGTTIEATFNGAVIGSAIDATYASGRGGMGENSSTAATRIWDLFRIDAP